MLNLQLVSDSFDHHNISSPLNKETWHYHRDMSCEDVLLIRYHGRQAWKCARKKHLLKHWIQFSTAPLWSAVKSVLPSPHTPTVTMEEGLHRCVQVVHTNTTLICAYNAPASKQRRDRVCVWYLYIQMTWNKWKTMNMEDMLATITRKSL